MDSNPFSCLRNTRLNKTLRRLIYYRLPMVSLSHLRATEIRRYYFKNPSSSKEVKADADSLQHPTECAGSSAKRTSQTTNLLHYKQGFQAQFTTVEFAKAVAEDGFLWSGSTFKGGVRTGGNFQLADTFSLDFDNQQEGQPTTVQDG